MQELQGSLLKHASLVVAAFAALAALLNASTALVGTWRDGRALKINAWPRHYGQYSDKRLVFRLGVSAFNPSRTPNRLVSVIAWRNEDSLGSVLPYAGVTIQPFGEYTDEFHIVPFQGPVDDVDEALNRISLFRIKIKPARGRARTFAFEPSAFQRNIQ